MYALGNFVKAVLRLDFRKLDDFRSKILWYFSFVKLTRNNVTQFCGDNARMRIVFARDVNAEHISISDPYVICFLKVELYRIQQQN